MLFELLTPDTHQPVIVNGSAVISRKQGFCLEDDVLTSGQSSPKFDCTHQGLSIGWKDIYESTLDCQWLDVTGVPGGNYLLRLTVNPDRTLPETNTTNNSAEVPVTI